MIPGGMFAGEQSARLGALLALAKQIGARPVQLCAKPATIITPNDLARLEQRRGL